MLYRLRGSRPGADFALGTLVEADGTSRSLPADTWSLQPLKRWSSPATGANYPVSWRLKVPGENIDLELRAVMSRQENLSPVSGIHYWEGAVIAQPPNTKVGGVIRGRGFVELTGYGEGSRPPV